jgi:hypothetical protein
MFSFYPCSYWGQSFFVTVGSFIMLNQLVAGSIMVRHMKLILVLSLPLRVYCLMRSTHTGFWGVIIPALTVHDCTFGLVFLFLARSSARFDITGWYVHAFPVMSG